MSEKFDMRMAVHEIERILREIDLDHDGKVQFTEFLIACCDKEKLTSVENLQRVFKLIDND